MSDSGLLYPGTVTTEASAPYDDQDWTNPTNVQADDTNDAFVDNSSYDAGVYTYALSNRAFGGSIPENATVVGVAVEVGKYVTVDKSGDALVQLINGVGTAIGDNYANVGVAWPVSAVGTVVYGGADDLWNTTLTPAIVNSNEFGIQFAATSNGNNGDSYVDFIRLQIYYNEAAGPATITTGEAYQLQVIDAPTMGAVSSFTTGEAYQLQIIDAASAVYIISAVTAEATQEQIIDAATLNAQSPITGTESVQLQVIDSASITAQSHLVCAEAVQEQIIDAASASLGAQVYDITVSESLQEQVIDTIGVTAKVSVTFSESVQTQVVDASLLTSIITQAIAEAVQDQVFESPTINTIGVVLPAECYQVQSFDSPALVASITIQPSELTQIQIQGVGSVYMLTPAFHVTVGETYQVQDMDAFVPAYFAEWKGYISKKRIQRTREHISKKSVNSTLITRY